MGEGPVPTLAELLMHGAPATTGLKVHFTNPDLQYLYERTGYNHRFLGRMVRIFGEGVVVEALRCSSEQGFRDENTLAGVCSRVRTG